LSSGLETASRSTARVAEVGLFDRDDALRSLLRRYEEVRDTGSLGIVAVSGDAGLGKTRLLLEFEARLRAGDETPRAAYGRALASNSVGNGFQPLREALADLLVEEEKKGRDRLRRLGSLIKDTAPDWLDALPVVGGVLHAAAVTAQQATASESVPDSMNAQFVALLEEVAGDRPVVLLLDDLHWADASTVDLLFFLSQRLRKPVLLVLAYRALDLRGREDHHPLRQALWRMERYCPVQPVELRPLTAGSLARLAEQVLASRIVDPDLVQWLARASEGNPLYVQEYLWYLQDTHAKAHDSPCLGRSRVKTGTSASTAVSR
jgi:predicted ATPase